MPFFSLCIISAVGQIALRRRTQDAGRRRQDEGRGSKGADGWPRRTTANTIVTIATVSSRSWLDCYLPTQWRMHFQVPLALHGEKSRDKTPKVLGKPINL